LYVGTILLIMYNVLVYYTRKYVIYVYGIYIIYINKNEYKILIILAYITNCIGATRGQTLQESGGAKIMQMTQTRGGIAPTPPNIYHTSIL